MPSASIDGLPMFYRTAGSGTPLLLLHGFPFTSDIFWPQLDAPPPGLKLVCPDLRGFGQTAARPGPSTMEAMAADCLALLDALQLPSVLVGGVSMGGYVALALTRLDPSRVKGLVLLDTQAGADDAAGQQRREQTAVDALAHGVSGLVDGMLPKLLTPHARPEVRARVEAMMRAQSPQAVAAASRGMAQREDSRDLLARFSGPALIVVGALDAITPVEKSRAMAEALQGSTLEVLEGVGHLAHLEASDRVGAALAAFARQVTGRG